MLFTDFVPERSAAGIVEFAEDIVGQDDRWRGGEQGVALEAGEAEGENEQALLAFGRVVGRILAGEEHAEVVALWPAESRARGKVGDTCLRPDLNELISTDVGLVDQVRALIREARAGAGIAQGYGEFG
jgi:hypothetical protein